MGRPLFSQTYPAVRTEPNISLSPYNKWNHWDAFDPDSDEFFDNDPVYEAFIDVSVSPTSGAEGQTLAVDESISSGSSEGSVSERGSPMAVGSDDPVRMLAEAYPLVDWERQHPTISADVRPPRTDASSQFTPRFSPTTPAQGSVRNRQRSATVAVISQRLPSSSLRNFISANPTDNLPRTSDITPISIPSRVPTSNNPTSPMTPQSPFIPSTPPSQMTPLSQLTPSPAPTVTPRILTWSSRPAISPGSSPQGNSPLTNPSARMSFAHIVPTLVRVRDVVI